jgi:general secretion pathway protein A
MYTAFFGLNEKPFSITPNPRYLYMSERHTEALAHLIYGIKESGGFIQLTGEVGTGKTTLIRGLLQRLPENADVALVLNPQLSATEFLAAILTELDIDPPEDTNSLKAMTDVLNEFLLENYSKGRRTMLIVDEAQNFAVDVLEQIRLLTNLETARHKLLQITLIGQPELRTMLARNDLRQLAQRITARYHLEPLGQEDTQIYVEHRLKVAGATRPIFSSTACRELFRLSGGIPRIINVIADRALLGAFTDDEHEIEPKLVKRAAAEVYGEDPELMRGWRITLRMAAVAGVAALLIGAAVYTAMRLVNQQPAPAVATLPAPAAGEPASAEPVSNEPADTAAAQPAEAVDQQTAEPSIASVIPDNAVAISDFATLLATNSASTDMASAFVSLFAMWNIAYAPGAERACDQARALQLACFYKQGALSQIALLNRPAILTVQDTIGSTHRVVLESLGTSDAMITIGDQTYRVELNDLSRYWFGEFVLLWRPQIAAVKAFFPGMTDPDVTWLRESLARIQGQPIDPMDSRFFDAELEARVRDYQINRRLGVDGTVGMQTQIVMNSDLNIGSPKLLKPTLARAN